MSIFVISVIMYYIDKYNVNNALSDATLPYLSPCVLIHIVLIEILFNGCVVQFSKL